MAATESSQSSAPGVFKTLQEEIAYYKSQYEQLEAELEEFQASSKELEAELEKEVEVSEKREHDMKKKVETLNYEVDEWRTKYKQSKAEANSAQSVLQKEITTLRETNRALQLRLRDIEVANDDFERQARHTTSSLEDLESKYHTLMEREVMLEEAIKAGEQERESLRIETQRLKDELSDLRIEAEITQEKLHAAENKRSSLLSNSKTSESVATTLSVSSITTPTTSKAESDAAVSEALTPPSPLSDIPMSFLRTDGASAASKETNIASSPAPKISPSQSGNVTARLGQSTIGRPRNTTRPSIIANNGTPVPTFARRTGASTLRSHAVAKEGLPRSGSLYQIRGLIGRMQQLEERVQSARSKLPAPTTTPPRNSPGASHVQDVPSTVTMRNSSKRTKDTTTDFATPSRSGEETTTRLSHRYSRASIGKSVQPTEASQPSNQQSDALQNATPSNKLSHRHSRSLFSGSVLLADSSRPSSRQSNASQNATTHLARPSSLASTVEPAVAATSNQQDRATESRRPRSYYGGSRSSMDYPQHPLTADLGNRPVSIYSSYVTTKRNTQEQSTPGAQRTIYDLNGPSNSTSTPATILKRQSSGITLGKALTDGTPVRRKSTKVVSSSEQSRRGEMGPPQRPQHAGLGETF